MKSILSKLVVATAASSMLLTSSAFAASGFGGGSRPSSPSPSRSYSPPSPSPSRSYTPPSPSRPAPAPSPSPSRSSASERPASSWSGSATYNSTSSASASRAYEERQDRAQRDAQRQREADMQRARHEREAQMMASRQAEQTRERQQESQRAAQALRERQQERDLAQQREQVQAQAAARSTPHSSGSSGTNWTGAILAGTAAALVTNAAMAHDSKDSSHTAPAAGQTSGASITPSTGSDLAKDAGLPQTTEESPAVRSDPLVIPVEQPTATPSRDVQMNFGSVDEEFTSYVPSISIFLLLLVGVFWILYFVLRSRGDYSASASRSSVDSSKGKGRKVHYKLK